MPQVNIDKVHIKLMSINQCITYQYISVHNMGNILKLYIIALVYDALRSFI